MTSKPDDAETPEGEPVGAPEGSEPTAAPVEDEPVAAPVPDERLLAAHDQALAALHEITPASTVGEAAGYTVEPDGVVSLRFENLMPGYPSWFWTVSLAVVDDAEPTVLEAELLPGDGALLAPDWVPWAVRLAEYQAQQVLLAAPEGEASGAVDDADDEDGLDDELEDELSDVDDLDAADFDTDGSRILHAGDVDGVDIDEFAESDDDEGSDDEDDDSDDDEGSDDDDEDSDDEDSDEDEDEFEDDDPDER